MTRVQKERFPTPEAYEAVRGVFKFAPADIQAMKPGARMMHPLPRVGEIAPGCDADPRAAYWRQVENGMYVRMALLAKVLGVEPNCPTILPRRRSPTLRRTQPKFNTTSTSSIRPAS